MKLCLGMMITAGEAPYLRLHLPHIAQCFDGMVVVYDPTEGVWIKDELRTLEDLPFSVISTVHRSFDNNWSAQYNAVIEAAERFGYDAILRLDADETMFPGDILAARKLLEDYMLLYFARINYWMDRAHYAPDMYPDWQGRCWLLNQGVRLGGQHHEGIVSPAIRRDRMLCVPTITLHHYGDVGRERILNRDLHYLNVAREQAGHPPLSERPADREFPTRHNIVYNGPQPIDPETVGIYAPWTE